MAALFLLGTPSLAQNAQQPSAPVQKQAVKKPKSPKAASQPGPAGASGPCNIGVIPTKVADHFAVKKIGLTVFGNEFQLIANESWKLADLMVDRVRAAAGPGITVRRIAYAQGALDSYRSGYPLLSNNDEKTAALIQQVAGTAHCDYYVVIDGGVSQYKGNQGIGGIGIVSSGAPLLERINVHAMLWINIHDGKTFAVLKRDTGSISSSNLLFGPPTRQLDGYTWPEAAEANDTPVVRDATRALVTEVLDKSLPALLR